MITQEVLDLFINKSDTREVLRLPFEINNKIYATDAYALIRVDKDMCDVVINNPYPSPDCESLIPPKNMNLKLDLSGVNFEKYLTEDELIFSGEDKICDECDGYGSVVWEYKSWSLDEECPKCKGYGLIEERQKVKSGKKIFGNQVVPILSTCLDINKFYKLVEVQKIIGGDINLIGFTQTRVLFSIGDCEILIVASLENQSKEFVNIKFE